MMRKHGFSDLIRYWLPVLGVLLLAAGFARGQMPNGMDGDVRRDLKVLKNQIRRERQRGARVRRRQETVLQEIDTLIRRRLVLQRELSGLDEEIAQVEKEVAVQEAEAGYLEETYRQLQRRFSARLKIRYCQPPGKWLDFLDRDLDLTEKVNAMVYGERVLAADRRLQAEYRQLLNQVREHRRELEKRRSFLHELRERQLAKVAELEENIAKKNELLYKIKHQVKAHDELVGELGKMAEKLEQMTLAADLPVTDFASLKGNLPMPVDGIVISFFGLEKDSDFATVTSNKGIEIEAPAGSPVRVIHSGVVVFASWMKGYGNLLVADHGGGYCSVYAHLREFSCKVGDHLKSRQVIGDVGNGVFSDIPSLYFEIRKNGVPEDPLTWVSQIGEQAG